jgi:hypothetical protein
MILIARLRTDGPNNFNFLEYPDEHTERPTRIVMKEVESRRPEVGSSQSRCRRNPAMYQILI